MDNNPQPNNENKSNPWCKREGTRRVCLTCNREIKSNPNGCTCEQHQESYRKKLVRSRAYWIANKERLVEANRQYRTEHPEQRIKAQHYQKQWYKKNSARKLSKGRDWEERNKEGRRVYQQKWHAAHREQGRESCRRYYAKNKTRKNFLRGKQLKAARAKDPGMRARLNLRSRLANCIRETKGVKTFSIRKNVFLYTSDQLRSHLERLFAPDMNWDNYVTLWEIDHIKPCDEFDLTVLEQAIACFSLENLRPLYWWINRSRYHDEKRKATKEESPGGVSKDVSNDCRKQAPKRPSTPGQMDLPM